MRWWKLLPSNIKRLALSALQLSRLPEDYVSFTVHEMLVSRTPNHQHRVDRDNSKTEQSHLEDESLG